MDPYSEYGSGFTQVKIEEKGVRLKKKITISSGAIIFLQLKKIFKENCLHLKLFFLFFLNLKHTGISESGSDSGIKLGQMQNPDKNSTYLEFRSTTLVSCTDPDRTLPYLLKYQNNNHKIKILKRLKFVFHPVGRWAKLQSNELPLKTQSRHFILGFLASGGSLYLTRVPLKVLVSVVRAPDRPRFTPSFSSPPPPPPPPVTSPPPSPPSHN